MSPRNHLIVMLLVGIALSSIASADDFIPAAALTKVVNYLPAQTFEPLQIVEINAADQSGSMHAHYVRNAQFFERSWHPIPIYKDKEPIQAVLIDSPDCSVQTLALHAFGNGVVDLIIAKRYPSTGHPFAPQDTPEPSEVTIFRLTRNVGQKRGYPPLYFRWIRSQVLADPVCTEADVDGELGNIPP